MLLAEYGKARYAYRDDVVMQVLGYSTDSECDASIGAIVSTCMRRIAVVTSN